MEIIIFCGIQATGKTSFYKQKFFKTHVRISLDQLNTRKKEDKFIETCLFTQQPFVIDNTNPTKVEREKYISLAKTNHYKVIGYYFQSKIEEAMARNARRDGKENIPEVGIKGTYAKLEIPAFSEGFDELYYVEITDNDFLIKNWSYEV